jgi:hypothetical protein
VPAGQTSYTAADVIKRLLAPLSAGPALSTT